MGLRRNGIIVSRTRRRAVVSFTSQPLYLLDKIAAAGQKSRYSLRRRLGGPQNRSEQFGQQNISFIWIIVQRDATICGLYFILLLYHSTCFGCLLHPSSGVHKTVITATGVSHMFVQLPHCNVATCGHVAVRYLHEHMTCTGGCNYSFMYSWWWAWTAPETCRVILQ